MRTIKLERVDSTNLYAKNLKEDVIVIAREQTAGRGTKGRSFSSLKGGLYLTKVVHDLPFGAKELFRVMTDAAVAVCRTAEAFGLHPSIKWANDVFLNGKKVCGILIENVLAGTKIASSSVGIGVNVNNPIPDELREIATSFSEEAGREIPLDEVEEVLLQSLERQYSLEEYRSYLHFLGKKITIHTGEESFEGIAKDVDEIGRLLVEREGKISAYAAAEVSIRL